MRAVTGPDPSRGQVGALGTNSSARRGAVSGRPGVDMAADGSEPGNHMRGTAKIEAKLQ